MFGEIPHMFSLMARTPFNRHLPKLDDGAPFAQRMLTLGQMAADGHLKPVVARTFPLEEAGDALRYMTEGKNVGRIVVVP